jgi:hypothetical protein
VHHPAFAATMLGVGILALAFALWGLRGGRGWRRYSDFMNRVFPGTVGARLWAGRERTGQIVGCVILLGVSLVFLASAGAILPKVH